MENAKRKIVIITPVYNDWDCLIPLSKDIADSLSGTDLELVKLIVVNDNSTEDFEDEGGDEKSLHGLPSHIINLAINVGHQRAIAIGLAYAKDNFSSIDYVLVMDSDGEDIPSYIPLLCKKCEEEKAIIFAARKKRSESFYFKVGYRIYKILFKMLTNQSINFGNYSCIPFRILPKIVVNPDLWNHYSSSLIKSKLKYSSLPTQRGARYKGKSKMNYQNLILHGFSSIAVYSDVVITKTLILSFVGLIFLLLNVTVLLGIRFFTDLAIPGWTSSILIALLNLLGSLFSIILLLLLIQLNQRRNILKPISNFYRDYISSINKYE